MGDILPNRNQYANSFWKVFLLGDGSTGSSQNSSSNLSEGGGESRNNCVQSCQCMAHVKTSRRRRLKSQSGYYLAIMPNGQILGVRDPKSLYIDIDIIPSGAGLVKLWGAQAELYLMIDDQGLLRGTDVVSTECNFVETFTEAFLNVYYSSMYFHKRWVIGIRSNKQAKTLYKKNQRMTTDTSFIIEIVKRRSSMSSTDESDNGSDVVT